MADDVKVTVLLNEAVDTLEYGVFSNHPIAFNADPVNSHLRIGKFEDIVFARPFLELMVHGQNGFTCEVNVYINDVKFNSKPILVKVKNGDGYFNNFIS